VRGGSLTGKGAKNVGGRNYAFLDPWEHHRFHPVTISKAQEAMQTELPCLFMLGLDHPNLSPVDLVESLEEFADTDDADIYLSDIRSAGEILIAYANAAEPVIARLADIRKANMEAV
jgi:hypothetical protein